MLDLLTRRDEIQKLATAELGRRFQEYDINCIAVLIGRPESKRKDEAGNDPIEILFDQLRLRRLAAEQVETYRKQEEAATRMKALKDAQSAAEKQTELTQTRIQVEIAQNEGEAQLARARRLAGRDIARAEGRSRSRELLGKGDAARIAQTGLAEAAVFLQKVKAYGDARLFALQSLGAELARSRQPLVPERLFLIGSGNGHGGKDGGLPAAGPTGMLGQLLALLLAEKAGVDLGGTDPETEKLQAFAEQVLRAGGAVPPQTEPSAGR
jgi:uncharacterized membrane protein YqiK